MLLVIVFIELVAIAATFQYTVALACADTTVIRACSFLRDLLLRGVAVFAVLIVYVPSRFRTLPAASTPAWRGSGSWVWPLVQISGALVILASALLGGGDAAGNFARMSPFWIAGAAIATIGTLFWLAPVARWRTLIREDGARAAVFVAVAFGAPEILFLVAPLWDLNPMTSVTFNAVAFLLRRVSADVWTDPSLHIVSFEGFAAEIGESCSGIEGLALICALLLFYILVDRRALRFPHAWLLIPIGLAASFALNIVRIVSLMWIGARVSPDLAVTGFHAYAGWLTFTTLALALIALSRAAPMFRRERGGAAAGLVPLRRDVNAAFIVPFMVCMLSSLVLLTFTPVPELWYPLRAVAMAAALGVFWQVFRSLDWRPDLLSVGAGGAIGITWVATAPGGASGDPLTLSLAALPSGLFLVWAVSRIAGTVLLVPLIEEAFFRGYVLRRFGDGRWPRIFGLLLSSALFALLHDRWIAAFVSGLIFGLLMWRRGRLADPFAAHACANAVIAGWAAFRGDWTVI